MDDLDAAIDGLAAPQQERDPIADAVDSVVGMDRARTSGAIRSAVSINPDQAAKARGISSRTGLPQDVVLRNLPELEQKDIAARIDAVSENSQVLSSMFRADPAFGQMAHDDVDNLSAIERVWRTGKAYAGAAPEGVLKTLGGALSGASEAYNIADRGLRAIAEPLLPKGLYDFLDQTTIPGWMDPTKQLLAKPGAAMKNLGRIAGPEGADRTFGTDVVAGIGQVGTQIVAALLTGGAASSSMLLAQGVDTMAEKTAQDNATQAEKDVAVALGAGWTAVTEKYGLDRLLNRVPPAAKNAALRKILDVAAGAGIEAAQEVAEGIGQDAIRRLFDSGVEVGAGVLNEASVAGAVGGIVRAALGVRSRGAQIQQANDQAEAMGEIDKLAADSKLRERSPETFASFMQQVQQDGPIRDVYVDARDLSEDALRQLVEASPAASQQVAQSLATGLDMQIPVGEFGANVAGQDWAKAVIPHLKTDPNGLSKAQADEAGKTKDADAAAGLDAALTGEEAADTFAQSRAAVEARVLEQSIATGRLTPDAHKPYAALTAARYAALASRLGITPEQAFERYPLNIAAETPAGEDFEQSAAFDLGIPEDGSQIRDVKIGDTTISLNVVGRFGNPDGVVDIASVRTPAKKRGAGSARIAMETLVRQADAQGVTLRLDASPLDAKTRGGRLVAFYESLGFQRTGQSNNAVGDPEMVRAPRAQTLNQGQQPVGASGPQQPVVRGTYTPEAKTIALLKDANFSTFLHESGHLYLDQTAQIAAEADAPAEIKADMQTLLDWFGIKAEEGASALEVWNRMTVNQQREHHEKFARGFELYAMEGKAPSHALAGAFQRFRGWLRRIYQSMASLNVQLTDEVRQVMDRMISTEAEIAEAKAAQSMGLMFNESDAAKLGIDYRAYQAQDADATGQAEQELDQRRIADLKWFEGAKSAALKELQRQASEKRREVKAEARGIVMAQPVYRAWAFLTGRTQAVVPGVTEIDTTEHSGKLRTSALVEMFGENGAWTKLRDLRMTAEKNGMHPDIVAEQFGYDSGEALVDALRMAQKPADAIDAMTDSMMLERYGDITSREALEQAALEAVTNRARTRVIATELNALEKAAKTTKRTVTKAAEAFAAQVVGRQAVGELRPEKFEAAARKAAAASLKAFKSGDIKKAATEKRNELVNTYAARAARDAQKQVDKKLALFKRAAQKPIAEVAKTRDADMVQAMRAILAEYGIGTKGEPAQKYLDALKSHDPDSYTRMADAVATLTAGAKDYRKISVDDFRALADELDLMWQQARRNRQYELDGDLIDLQEAQEPVVESLEHEGVPGRIPGEGYSVTQTERFTATLREWRAALRRIESWCYARDGGPQGAMRKFIWNPINDASERYVKAQAEYRGKYLAMLEKVDLGKARIEAPELGYTFGRSKGGSGKQEILHALLHTGNDSNKRKLLLGRDEMRKNPKTGKLEKTGRKWADLLPDGTLDTSRWDAFRQRMFDNGIITKADMDFVQGVWDLLEETKVGAQQTHRQVFGRSFDEIAANEVQTPWGVYRGGYVPAMADPEAVSDAKTRGIIEEENQTMTSVFPQTARGFTKNRVEYNRALLLDLRALAGHIDKVLMFTHLESPVRDVRRLLFSDPIRTPLSRMDSSAYDGMLTPWLNRVARQQVETPVPGSNGLMRWISKIRSRAGMAAMIANVANAAQQVTGLSVSMVRIKKGKHMRAALVQYLTGPGKMAKSVTQASPYMESRMANEIHQMNLAIDDILLNPNVYQQAQAWTARHGYLFQQFVDNHLSPIIWTASYNDAMQGGASEVDAIRQADSTVRETQGSNRPQDISQFEAGTAFKRLFTQFQGWANTMANTQGTEFVIAMRDMGLRAGMGRGLYVFLMASVIPAVVSQAIVEGMRGGPDDEDGDGYLDDWLASLGLGLGKSVWALVPVVGPVTNVFVNSWNNKPYDDKISTAPAISLIEQAGHSPFSAYNAIAGDGSARKAVRDFAALISLTTGLPASALARPIGYGADVMQGRVEPTGPADAIRGAISGAASPESKR